MGHMSSLGWVRSRSRQTVLVASICISEDERAGGFVDRCTGLSIQVNTLLVKCTGRLASVRRIEYIHD